MTESATQPAESEVRVIATGDAEVITASRALLEEASRSAGEQREFHSGPSLALLTDELAWAARTLARPLPTGTASKRAAARSAVRELLRCWVSLQGVLREAGRYESWPDVGLAQNAMAAFLSRLSKERPELLAQSSEILSRVWVEADGDWVKVREDGVALLCSPFRTFWIAKVAGVFCGQAETREEAFEVAERQSDHLFGNEGTADIKLAD